MNPTEFRQDISPKASLAEKLADEIIAYILKNRLKAGDKLPNEYQLSAILNAGRGSVREAVKLLISRNVIEIRRGDGTYISSKQGIAEDPLGLTFVQDKRRLAQDLLEIRFMIEPKIAAYAAENAGEEDIRELSRLCDETEGLIRQGENHASADMKFHSHIALSSKNLVAPRLIPIIQNAIFLLVDLTRSSLLKETIEGHRELFNAIAHRRPTAAYDAMYLHLVYNRRMLGK